MSHAIPATSGLGDPHARMLVFTTRVPSQDWHIIAHATGLLQSSCRIT